MAALVDEEAQDWHAVCQDHGYQGVCVPRLSREVRGQSQHTQGFDPGRHIFALEVEYEKNIDHPTHDYVSASGVRRCIDDRDCSGCGRSARERLESRGERLDNMEGETVLAETLGITELNQADERSLQVLQEQHDEAIDEEDDAEGE